MTNTPLSIGMIGPRGFGAFCTDVYHQSGEGRVVAYAGRNAEAMQALARQHGVARTYTDWRQMLTDPTVELVHIVTPPDLHAEMAIAALNAGKHVLIEKPLATRAEDAQAILQAAARAHRVAGINYVMRYNALYQCVGKIARAGWLGRLTHVGFKNYASDEGLADDHWFWDRAQSGGIFVEHGVHFFDIIGQIAQSPARRVLGQTLTRADGTGKEDRVQAIVSYENGVEASFYHAFNRPGALEKQTAHFAFEQGHVTLNGWIPNSLHLNAVVDENGLAGLKAVLDVIVVDDEDFPAPGREIKGGGRLFRVRHRVHAQETLAAPTPIYRAAVQAALADLAQAIRIPAHHPLVTAGDGAVSLRVALAAKASAETRQPQEL